jgi:hypothetical protein
MKKRFKCFSINILDYYNITVHSLVCNKYIQNARCNNKDLYMYFNTTVSACACTCVFIRVISILGP